MASLPLVTRDLLRRVARVEAECRVARLELLRDDLGDPLGTEVHRHGEATAVVCRARPESGYLNSVIGLGPEHLEALPEILAPYRRSGIRPRVPVLPGWCTPPLAAALAGQGLTCESWSTMLYRTSTPYTPPPADGLTVRRVEAGNVADFARLFVDGFGLRTEATDRGATLRFLTRWIEVDWWRLYLADFEGEPAAIGVLALRDGIGYLAAGATAPRFRGHGLQTALIWQRVADAAEAGCRVCTVETGFDSTSQHNTERCGFHVACTYATWAPLA